MEMAWFAVHCIHASAPAPLCQLEEQPEAQPEQQLPEQAVPATGPPAPGKRQGLFPSLCMMPSTKASFDYCSRCCFLLIKFSGLCETSLPRLLCKLFKSKAYLELLSDIDYKAVLFGSSLYNTAMTQAY